MRARSWQWSKVAAGAALIAVLAPVSAWAAPQGTPPPTVVAAALDGSSATFPQCDGSTPTTTSPGFVKVERPNATSGDLSVEVSYSGTLTPGTDYDALPDPVVIPAGQDATILSVTSTKGGTVTLTIDPGTGYTVGTPASATATIVANPGGAGCQAEVVETIAVGQVPTAVPIYQQWGQGIADTVLSVTGTEPPGVTYHVDGTWTGAATTTGLYRFTVCYALGTVCAVEIPFAITVIGGDVPPPAPPPPASPVGGTATFTG